MADFYGNLGKISHSLIKQFGQPCSVTINEQGRYNPATGERKKVAQRFTQAIVCLIIWRLISAISNLSAFNKAM